MANYVDVEVPQELQEEIKKSVKRALSDGGRVRKGVNEVTKAIERKKALLVVVAEDVNPPEIVMHIPILCAEKGIPCGFMKNQKDVGQAAGIEVGCSAIAVIDAGKTPGVLDGVSKELIQLRS